MISWAKLNIEKGFLLVTYIWLKINQNRFIAFYRVFGGEKNPLIFIGKMIFGLDKIEYSTQTIKLSIFFS